MLQQALLKVKRHGAANTAYLVAVKLLAQIADFRILRGVFVAQPDASFLACPARYEARLLSEAELRRFARDPASELSDAFIDEALARGDQCYAILDGDRLAAYGWYAFGPTPIGLPGLLLHYRTGCVYMYKGFTHNEHRGKRLHAIGMTRALQHYLSKGYEGIVSYVESTNFDSLKSCFRMGYFVFGSVYIVNAFGRTFSHSTPGCREYAFRVERTSVQSATGVVFGK
ncbi:MAG: hypothetical protein QOD26_1522 [Betaproteobacteria bacterium]|jgi:hypothetical protein|nr:hypothetical protein [Betaproteobacteria bacterium]